MKPASAAAYTVNGNTVPAEVFYAVACNPAHHVVVEACAGAGKTWMLVSRILRALLAGAEPQQILAITFTKKAAAEMRGRLNEWLADFAGKPEAVLVQELVQRGMTAEDARSAAPTLRGLYLQMLQHGRSVQIRTFHGWFAALLQAAPLQVLQRLGLPLQYELIEDDAMAIARAWRPFHQALLQQPAALDDYHAIAAEHGRSNTMKALEAALAKRVEFALADAQGMVETSVAHFTVQFPDMRDCGQPADAVLVEPVARQALLDAARILGQASAKTHAAKGAELEQAITGKDWPGLCKALFTLQGEPRKFGSNILQIEVVKAAQERVQRVMQAVQQHAAWLHHQRMTRLTRLLLQTYAEVKRQHGWVDMSDIEQSARVLLQDATISGWVQERLDARIRHLLVDEFQDTNPMQWQALRAWLEGYTGAATAPGVFIVGDPKQSIYRFRRADPQVFQDAREFVQQGLQGAVLHCDHTRRNSQPVIDAVNAVMGAAQAGGRYEGFRPHTTGSGLPGAIVTLPAIERPAKAGPDAAESAWRDSLTTPRVQEEELLVERECRQAARWLQRCVHAGTPLGEILVIARKNDRLAVMQHALAEVGLAAHKAEKMPLADAPEVQDIVALMDALVSPRHDLSLARALKSPVFDLGDDDLVEIALGVQQAARCTTATDAAISWLHWLLPRAQQPGTRFHAIASTLQRWQGWVQQQLPHDALHAIYHDGDILQRYARRTPAIQRASVLERLQALPGHMLALDGGRYASAYQWVRALRGSDPAKAPQAVQPDSIRLLTVHGAKGLEAGVVLLLDTDAGKGRSKHMDVLVRWPGTLPHPDQFVFVEAFGNPPPSSALLVEQEMHAEAREEANALYVAMTRARQVLAFSSTQPRSPQAHSWWTQWAQHAQAHELPVGAVDEGAPWPAAGWPQIQSSRGKEDKGRPASAAGALRTLPALPPELQSHSQATTELLQRDAHLQLQAAMGEAMHKALEWHQSHAVAHDRDAVQRALQTLYQLTAEQADTALRHAHAILHGEAAWAWDAAQIDWQANELDIAWQGQVLRIDRLVHRKAQGCEPACWWVLDFKSALAPQEQQGLREQLDHYRQAVMALYPEAEVRAAFIGSDGRLTP